MNTRKIIIYLLLVPTFYACSNNETIKHKNQTKTDKKSTTKEATLSKQISYRNRRY
jgi:hypothetical protein